MAHVGCTDDSIPHPNGKDKHAATECCGRLWHATRREQDVSALTVEAVLRDWYEHPRAHPAVTDAQHGVVYIARSGDEAKIGMTYSTCDPSYRMGQIAWKEKIEIDLIRWWVVSYPLRLEHGLHEWAGMHRTHGEWFTWGGWVNHIPGLVAAWRRMYPMEFES